MSPYIEYNASATAPAPLTTFTWKYRTEGQEGYEATGTCPVCACVFTAHWPWGQTAVAKGGIRNRRKEPDTTRPWPYDCACSSPHPGRPADVYSGCGAYLQIALPDDGLPR
jgi:hypothetical protein